MNRSHFDAWGRKTLDYASMVRWYQGDEKSLEVLRSLPSVRYAIIPNVELRISTAYKDTLEIISVWPGGNSTKRYFLSDHGINALRRLYRSSETQWRHSKGENCVIWKRRGCLVRAVWCNFFPVEWPFGG